MQCVKRNFGGETIKWHSRYGLPEKYQLFMVEFQVYVQYAHYYSISKTLTFTWKTNNAGQGPLPMLKSIYTPQLCISCGLLTKQILQVSPIQWQKAFTHLNYLEFVDWKWYKMGKRKYCNNCFQFRHKMKKIQSKCDIFKVIKI